MFKSHIVKKNIKNQYSITTTEHTSDSIFTTEISNQNGEDLSINVGSSNVLTLNNQTFPSSDGTANQVLSTDGNGALSWVNPVNLSHIDIVDDDSPQLGGNLDMNSYDISGTGNINITGTIQSSASITCSDLTVNGSTTHLNTETLTVDDPLIYLGENNSANTIDLGWYGKFNDGSDKYSGVIRDATDGHFKFFTSSSSPTTVVSNFTLNTIECGDIECDEITANKLDVDNLRLNLNILSSTANNLKLTASANNSIELNNSILITDDDITSVNSIGIGTSSPNEKLSVAGNIEILGENQIIFTKDTDGTNIARIKSHIHGLILEELRGSLKNRYTLGDGTHIWACGANTEERMKLNQYGNLGIGTNDPTKRLSIQVDDTNDDYDGFYMYDNSSGSSQNLIALGRHNQNGTGYMRIYNQAVDTDGIFLYGAGQSFINGGNLGIGTNNPLELLHVKGAHGIVICEGTNSSGNFHAGVDIIPQSRIRTRGIRIRNGTDDNQRWLIGNKYSSSHDNLNFLYTSTGEGTNAGNYTEFMTIKTDGSVGIGSNNPKYNLHIYENESDQYLQARFENADTSGRAGIQMKNGTHTLNIQQNNGSAIFENYGDGSTNFYQKGTGSYYFKCGDSNTDRMYIGNDGNVGVGRNNPAYLLDVNGTFRTNANAHLENDVILGEGNNQRFTIHTRQAHSGDFLSIVPDNSSGAWEWGKGITLKRDGKIGIGRTSPSYLLDVNGNCRIDDTLVVYSSGEGIKLGNHEIKLTNSGVAHWSIINDDGGFLDFRRTSGSESLGEAGSSFLSIKSDGNVGIGNTSPTQKLEVAGSVLANNFLTDGTLYGMNQNYQVLSMSTNNSTDCRRFLLKHKSDASGVFRTSFDYQSTSTGGQTELFSIVGNGEIGIGTDNPSGKLHIQGNGDMLYFGTERPWKFHTNGTVGASTALHLTSTVDSKNFIIDHNGDERIARFNAQNDANDCGVYLVEGGGRVGIGTGIASQKFHIHGQSSSFDNGGHLWATCDQDTYPVYQQLNWTHDNIALSFDSYYNGAWRMSDTGSTNSCCQFYKINDNLNLRYAYDTQQGNSITWNDSIVVNLKNGNVGIGASPVQKLDVYGDAFIGASGKRWRIGSTGYTNWAGLCHSDLSGSSYCLMQHNTGATLMNCASNSYIGFRCNNTEYMRMRSTGNLGIGTTNPSYKLHVYGGDIKCDDLYTTRFEFVGVKFRTHHNTDMEIDSARDLYFQTDGNTKMILKEGGNFGIGLTNPSEKLDVVGNIKATGVFMGGESGAVVKIKCLEWSNGADCNSSSWTDSQTLGYTKKVGTNLIITSAFDYQLNGYGSDHFESRLKVSDDANTYVDDYGRSVRQHFDNHSGGGSRSNTLNAIMVQTDSSFVNRTNVYITLQLRKSGADDYMNIYEGYFLVHEVIA